MPKQEILGAIAQTRINNHCKKWLCKKMADGSTIIEARNIGRRAANAWLLHEISFGLKGGDRLALVGPTGSGKTLLLRAVAMLDQIDAGEILWRGQTVVAAQVPRYRSNVIYLHQKPALFEGTVEDNLRGPFLLGTHRQRSYDRTRIMQLLDALSRDAAFLQKQHHDLSGGEAQIVALLRAIQLDPEALLLDEPTAALDTESTTALESLVDLWLGEKPLTRAALWVSHDTRQAERVANRQIFIENGRLDRKK